MFHQISDALYDIKERRKLSRFRALIAAGVEKCEPRYRPITELKTQWATGTVEHAHVSRYEFAALRISGRVLNAACGSGYGNAILARVASPVGIDLYDEPLEIARRNFAFGEYHRGDVLTLPFSDDTFDGVVSFETIEHVSDAAAACNQLKRVLKPGGTLVASIPIMIFHNPGSNFTWAAAQLFVQTHFAGAELYLQDNWSIEPLCDQRWRQIRACKDKFVVWVWRKQQSTAIRRR